MTYSCYVNGEKRYPTKDEKAVLLDRMMRCLGYEKKNKQGKKEASA